MGALAAVHQALGHRLASLWRTTCAIACSLQLCALLVRSSDPSMHYISLPRFFVTWKVLAEQSSYLM
jgi:hypothetical protein